MKKELFGHLINSNQFIFQQNFPLDTDRIRDQTPQFFRRYFKLFSLGDIISGLSEKHKFSEGLINQSQRYPSSANDNSVTIFDIFVLVCITCLSIYQPENSIQSGRL